MEVSHSRQKEGRLFCFVFPFSGGRRGVLTGQGGEGGEVAFVGRHFFGGRK